MRKHWLIALWLVCFIFSATTWGQEKPVPESPSRSAGEDDDDRPVPPPSTAAAAVPADAPVLTIKGLCAGDEQKEAKEKSGCERVITRAEFEKIARAIQPSMTPVVKRQLLALYPRLLIMSHEAEVRGLDKEEYSQQMVAFARMQILTQQLTREVQEEAGKVPEKDIADYYHKHPETFTEYSLERIFVPRMKQEPPPSTKLSEEGENQQQKNAEMEMAKLADSLRSRAANGESFDVLQKEAYQVAGLKSNPPNTSMGKIRRTGLPPAHVAVFNLKAGEISPVFGDSSGHYIYKVENISMETLPEAKDEIHNMLQTQRMKDLMDKIQGPFTTQVNDAYFDSGPSSARTGNSSPK
jgi:hypothetical protein